MAVTAMSAWRTDGYHRIEIQGPGTPALVTARVRGRSPGRGWALIAPRAVGVCRSDLKELLGVRQGRRDFGHELVADVVACADAGTLAPGDTVVLDPHVALERTSGFAELVEFHGAARALESALLRVPPGLAASHATFVEPLACAARCVRRVRDAAVELGGELGGDHRDAAVAVVGAGIFGTLIAALLRGEGRDVVLLNRSRARLDFLAGRQAFPATRLTTLRAAAAHRFGTIVLATTFAEPDLVAWCAEHATDSALVTIFAGTAAGMTVGDDRTDLDALRRGQQLRELPVDGRPLWFAGCHGAERRDFRRAMTALSREPQVARTVAGLRGPQISLHEAVRALPEYARGSTYGKPIVALPGAPA